MAAFTVPDKLSFSGKEGEDLEKFLSKVEMYCIALGLAEIEEEQCAVLGGLLEGVAYQKFSELSPTVRKQWKGCVSALREEFVDRRKMACRQQFLKTVWIDGQDFSVFVQGLSRLARLAYSGDSEDVVMSRVCKRAILVCKDASIRQFLLENETKQWTDLVKATQIKEDARKIARRMALGGSGSGVVGAFASPFEHCGENELIGSVNHGSYGNREWLKGELKAMEERLWKKLSVGSLPNVKPQPNRTKSQGRKCRQCKSFGHSISDCPDIRCHRCGEMRLMKFSDMAFLL